jgi:hypothetical protein
MEIALSCASSTSPSRAEYASVMGKFAGMSRTLISQVPKLGRAGALLEGIMTRDYLVFE